MIEFEETLQRGRIGLAALHRVDVLKLAGQQVLVASTQVDERCRHVLAAQTSLLRSKVRRGLLDGVERVCEVLDLVAGVQHERRDFGKLIVVAEIVNLGDHVRQRHFSGFNRSVTQASDWCHQAATEEQGDECGNGQAGKSDQHEQDRETAAGVRNLVGQAFKRGECRERHVGRLFHDHDPGEGTKVTVHAGSHRGELFVHMSEATNELITDREAFWMQLARIRGERFGDTTVRVYGVGADVGRVHDVAGIVVRGSFGQQTSVGIENGDLEAVIGAGEPVGDALHQGNVERSLEDADGLAGVFDSHCDVNGEHAGRRIEVGLRDIEPFIHCDLPPFFVALDEVRCSVRVVNVEAVDVGDKDLFDRRRIDDDVLQCPLDAGALGTETWVVEEHILDVFGWELSEAKQVGSSRTGLGSTDERTVGGVPLQVVKPLVEEDCDLSCDLFRGTGDSFAHDVLAQRSSGVSDRRVSCARQRRKRECRRPADDDHGDEHDKQRA